MTFSVNISALAGLPESLDRRDADLTQAMRYLAANTRLRDGTGLANVLGVHQRVQAGITAYLDDVAGTYALTDAMRVRAAITSYQQSDARAAKRADTAIAGVPGGLAQGPPLTATEMTYGPSIFDDRVTPLTSLAHPADHHAEMPYQPNWFDVLSPSSIARDTIWKLTSLLSDLGIVDRPYDPFEVLVEPFVGDWAGLLRCAEVFDHIGGFLSAGAQCVHEAKETVPLAWTGNVAGMCGGNLHLFATTLSAGVPPLAAIAATYREVARGVQDNANLIEMVITNLIDQAIDGALDEATFGLFDIYDAGTKIHNFVKTLLAAVRIATNVVDLVSAGFAASNDAVNRLGILRNVAKMPALRFPPPQIPLPVPPQSKPRVPVPHQ